MGSTDQPVKRLALWTWWWTRWILSRLIFVNNQQRLWILKETCTDIDCNVIA